MGRGFQPRELDLEEFVFSRCPIEQRALCLRKWLLVLAFVGAVWMTFVIYRGSPRFALISNYPGVYAARWIHFRGIAPSSTIVWMFNVWLVLTSALEWVTVGMIAWMIAREFSKVI